MLAHIDASIALHEQTLAFIAASFDDGSGSISVATHAGSVVHLLHVVLGAGPGQLRCHLLQPTTVMRVWCVNLVQCGLHESGALTGCGALVRH